MDIQYDRYSLIINGKREFIRSGAMHYFRLPSQDLWRDRLFKLKAAGYNTVDLYFCWNYHSPAPGVYDFTGIRDVEKLLEITQELGLYVIARPGPYINAEYSGGGFPGWLLAKKHLPLRNRREGAFEWSDEYMGYVREWWEQIVPRINKAPNVLMVQIENEYATLEVEPDYMQALADMTRKLGVKVPLYHND
jgi:beta-galactosidase GanA